MLPAQLFFQLAIKGLQLREQLPAITLILARSMQVEADDANQQFVGHRLWY
jgi:hypothetical protein